MSFLAEQYTKNVEFLRQNGLWDFEWRLILNPILQHCMPPPTVKAWKVLTNRLLDLEIDTDWAPQMDVHKAYLTFVNLPDTTSTTCDEGTEYPIYFAITQSSLYPSWPKFQQATFLNDFIERVYFCIASENELKSQALFYQHVYRLRDVMICEFAENYELKIKKSSAANIEDKKTDTEAIRNGYGYIGSEIRSSTAAPFWYTPPIIEVPRNLKKKRKSDPVEPSEAFEELDTPQDFSKQVSKNGVLNSDEQKVALKRKIPVFIRNNVRSLADPNQLSWSCILKYWDRLLSKGKEEIFILSLLSLLTGIQRNRWRNFTIGSSSDICSDNIVFDPDNCCLYYEVHNLATVFEEVHEGRSNTQFCLILPDALSQSIEELGECLTELGLNDSTQIDGFSKELPGPSPTINRVANSGLHLFRKRHLSEDESHILSGSIPIEFRVRNCYVSRNISDINTRFSDATAYLFSELKQDGLLDRYKMIPNKLTSLLNSTSGAMPGGIIGSQLGHTFRDVDFTTVNVSRPDELRTDLAIEQILDSLNTIEAYFYWMTQYGYGNRPAGDKTETERINNWLIHLDKDSQHYVESKLLEEIPLINEQFNEVLHSRKYSYRQIKRLGSDVRSIDLELSRPLFHRKHKQSGTCYNKPMNNRVAVQIVKEKFDIDFPFARPNASRHHTSTAIHELLSPQHADQCLGHHIDGWDPTALESTGIASEIIRNVKKVQERLLKDLTFTLLRSPWL